MIDDFSILLRLVLKSFYDTLLTLETGCGYNSSVNNP